MRIVLAAAIITISTCSSSQSIKSPYLTITSRLSSHPDTSIDRLLTELQNDFPTATFDRAKIEDVVSKLMFPTSVPAWLHERLLAVVTPETLDYKDPALVASVLAHCPPTENPRYKDPKTVAEVIDIWVRLCINPLRAFKRAPACTQSTTTLPDGTVKQVWRLMPGKVGEHMFRLALAEHDRLHGVGKKRTSEATNQGPSVKRPALEVSTTAIPTTMPSLPTTPRELVIRELIKNWSVADNDLLTSVNSELQVSQRLSPRDLDQIRTSIASVAVIPEWLFNALWYFRADCSHENGAMMGYIDQQAPRNFVPRAGWSKLISVWRELCIEAMDSYFASEEEGKQLPCEYDVKTKRYILPPHSIRKYLENLA